jgi:hypothetical protein
MTPQREVIRQSPAGFGNALLGFESMWQQESVAFAVTGTTAEGLMKFYRELCEKTKKIPQHTL